MNIYEKLEDIRKKPEYVRLRYVWLAVAVSMLLILIIWFLSLKSGLENSSGGVKLPEIPAMPQGLSGAQNNPPASVQGEGFSSGDSGINDNSDNNFYNKTQEEKKQQEESAAPDASDLLNTLGN